MSHRYPRNGRGATAQILNAVAEQRGKEHSRHRHHLVMANRLRAETGISVIRRVFAVASALRENFYEDEMDADRVAESLDDVEALRAKLTPLLNRTQPPLPRNAQ